MIRQLYDESNTGFVRELTKIGDSASFSLLDGVRPTCIACI